MNFGSLTSFATQFTTWPITPLEAAFDGSNQPWSRRFATSCGMTLMSVWIWLTISGTTTQMMPTRTATMRRITVTIAHVRVIPWRSKNRTSGSRPTVMNIARKIEKTIVRRL